MFLIHSSLKNSSIWRLSKTIEKVKKKLLNLDLMMNDLQTENWKSLEKMMIENSTCLKNILILISKSKNINKEKLFDKNTNKYNFKMLGVLSQLFSFYIPVENHFLKLPLSTSILNFFSNFFRNVSDENRWKKLDEFFFNMSLKNEPRN